MVDSVPTAPSPPAKQYAQRYQRTPRSPPKYRTATSPQQHQPSSVAKANRAIIHDSIGSAPIPNTLEKAAAIPEMPSVPVSYTHLTLPTKLEV